MSINLQTFEAEILYTNEIEDKWLCMKSPRLEETGILTRDPLNPEAPKQEVTDMRLVSPDLPFGYPPYLYNSL